MIIFTRPPFDNGWDIMDLLFLHHIFIIIIGISSAPNPSKCIHDYSICEFDPIRTLSAYIVFLILIPDTCYGMLPLNFKRNRSNISVMYLFIFSPNEINRHKYTNNFTFICTFNVFRGIHFICIFQNFLDPGKRACPPPKPSPCSGAIRSLAKLKTLKTIQLRPLKTQQTNKVCGLHQEQMINFYFYLENVLSFHFPFIKS